MSAEQAAGTLHSVREDTSATDTEHARTLSAIEALQRRSQSGDAYPFEPEPESLEPEPEDLGAAPASSFVIVHLARLSRRLTMDEYPDRQSATAALYCLLKIDAHGMYEVHGSGELTELGMVGVATAAARREIQASARRWADRNVVRARVCSQVGGGDGG
jgi:hypothetical protein